MLTEIDWKFHLMMHRTAKIVVAASSIPPTLAFDL